ncbi:ATP-binding protein [Janibacter cremeus]|uniref:Uncharacterized protein (TIGR00290 family) n=1 Tax=Janibacter cremeus TaxID=1285192 RepID=A0A852VRM9_9MICO|nr:ATP-binding protein [Janibacter cremeus]NYF98518.1 uncharacterized protein (TIGR00290 family) [Janibacter cremeus]
MRTVAFHWSGGKDSALALTALLDDPDVVVDRLVTTVHREGGTSTVHEIPDDLLQAQADSIGLPLQIVAIPGPGLDGYVEAMDAAATRMRREGIDAFAFGDLSASGVLDHKREQFQPLGIDVLEPLWGLSSGECVERFLASGIRAVTVVVDAAVLGPQALGLPLDRAFFAGLPAGADPCGELGEFHSFSHDGPLFRRPVDFELTAPRRFEQEIGTTDGARTFAYWLSTPRARR